MDNDDALDVLSTRRYWLMFGSTWNGGAAATSEPPVGSAAVTLILQLVPQVSPGAGLIPALHRRWRRKYPYPPDTATLNATMPQATGWKMLVSTA